VFLILNLSSCTEEKIEFEDVSDYHNFEELIIVEVMEEEDINVISGWAHCFEIEWDDPNPDRRVVIKTYLNDKYDTLFEGFSEVGHFYSDGGIDPDQGVRLEFYQDKNLEQSFYIGCVKISDIFETKTDSAFLSVESNSGNSRRIVPASVSYGCVSYGIKKSSICGSYSEESSECMYYKFDRRNATYKDQHMEINMETGEFLAYGSDSSPGGYRYSISVSGTLKRK
jgi:hypothetical protein